MPAHGGGEGTSLRKAALEETGRRRLERKRGQMRKRRGKVKETGKREWEGDKRGRERSRIGGKYQGRRFKRLGEWPRHF